MTAEDLLDLFHRGHDTPGRESCVHLSGVGAHGGAVDDLQEDLDNNGRIEGPDRLGGLPVPLGAARPLDRGAGPLRKLRRNLRRCGDA